MKCLISPGARALLATLVQEGDGHAHGMLILDKWPETGGRLGRLIRQKQSLPEDDDPRTTHLYYDGVRRIHESYVESMGPLGGDFLEMLLEGESLGGLAGAKETEYVWGPDYVDELAFFLNSDGYARYVLLDANYNVMGVAKPNGDLVAQWAYGPYGDVRRADWKNANSPTPLSCGHQGLFFVRLDGSVSDPPLEPDAIGLYYNRNRWLSPHLGRFLQRDPHISALALDTATMRKGHPSGGSAEDFGSNRQYADGLNLYVYVAGNPAVNGDPYGRFSSFAVDAG